MSTPDQVEDEGIDLREVLRDLRRKWWLIASVSVACGLLAALAAWVVPKEYEADTVLSPVADDASSGGFAGGSSAMGALGGLASLAGISTQAGSMREYNLATLQSDLLAEEFIRRNALVDKLLRDTPIEDGQGSSPEARARNRLWVAKKRFTDKLLTISENTRSGIVTLSLRWTDPDEASKWANGYVQLTNSFLRDKAIAGSERNIAYLNDQLAKTSVVELRSAIFSLMESEIRREMLARGSDEYALKVIDPAVSPEKPVSPRPVLWVVAGLILGGLAGCIYALASGRRRARTAANG